MPDVRVLRQRLDVFADTVGVPLTDWQARSLECGSRVTVIVGARQLGKSRGLAVKALHAAFRAPGQRVLVVSAGEDAARRLLAEVRGVAVGSPLLRGSVVDENAGLLTLSNGSEVRSVPASERQIRGWAVDLLIVDEASLVSDDVGLNAAMPTTAARPDARVVLAGTATTASGWFYDFARNGETGSEHVRTVRWVSRLVGGDCDTPWLSASAVEAARESMSPQRFAAEYLADFASGADALITRATLDRVTVDFVQEPLGGIRGPANVLAGVDWASGLGRDRSVVCVIRRPLLGSDEPRFAVSTAHGWHADTPTHQVVEDLAACPARWAGLFPESNGLGAPLSEALRRRMRDRPRELGGGRRRSRTLAIDPFAGRLEDQLARIARGNAPWWEDPPEPVRPTVTRPIHVSAELKASAYGGLRLALNTEKLLIPASATDLIRELLLLRVEVMPSGLERIETGGRDFASALMLATGPYQGRGGKWRSTLQDLIEHPLPSVRVPDEVRGLPRVMTPGGVELPRTPAWMGVTDQMVTWPSGVVPRSVDERLARMRAARRAALSESVELGAK